MNQRATVKDVAKAAGVSASIVSRVMNGAQKSTSRVSEATTEKVREAAKKLGYTRFSSASVLRTKQTFTIAVLGGFHPQTGWFYPSGNMEMLAGVNRALAEDKRYKLLLDLERTRRSDGVPALYEGRVDGAIVMEYLDEQLLKDLKATSTPFVTANVEPGLNAVYPEDISGLRHVLEKWKNEGVKRVVYLQDGWLSEHYSTIERRHELLKFAKELNLDVHINLYSRETKVHELSKELENSSIEGIICYSESTAQALAHNSLLDSNTRYKPRLFCWTRPTREHMIMPWISRIAIPFEDMGAVAAKMLIRILDQNSETLPARYPCPYIEAIKSCEEIRWVLSPH